MCDMCDMMCDMCDMMCDMCDMKHINPRRNKRRAIDLQHLLPDHARFL